MGSQRRIIDSNALQTEALRIWLAEAPRNFAVLTDYAAMEAYKGDTLASIFKSMAILSDFPRQVIVLKPTIAICGLRGRDRGLQKRMIDREQTVGFPQYCDALRSAELGNASAQAQLLELGQAADAHMDRMLHAVTDLGSTINSVSSVFTPTELRTIRTNSQYSRELIRKLFELTLELAKLQFSSHPNPPTVVNAEELPSTFIFRHALCSVLLVIDWIAVGGPKNVKSSRIRNDVVDVTFATYATYFDGLMSADEKPVRIYDHAALALDGIRAGLQRK